MVYGLVAVVAGYFFEQSWYLMQVLRQSNKGVPEAGYSTFFFLLILFFIGYSLCVVNNLF